MSRSQIEYFQINLFNGNIIHRPVSRFCMLDDILRNYTRNYISQIIFYFNDPILSFRTLTLRNTQHNNIFVVEFFHTYNHLFEKIEMSDDQKIADYQAVLNLLNRTRNINVRFTPFIINPFHQQPIT